MARHVAWEILCRWRMAMPSALSGKTSAFLSTISDVEVAPTQHAELTDIRMRALIG
ncbi:hypothetical protein SNOG_01313 [Parastagonospora nodorum SN15]|uniref:Uncharacterized protein n=1 Tax=Phaeosphaeria nodorum (strain SN15 / ATCC MYA-4574 / FGSC 10173) TaxID=321614 RepID=Q0V3V1_PHANO|nr:hypothetical protein SNOG_01313 [Parastagonospora nodorum SN15]EAT90962.1 hypothetical protein SNOG_01313 [Parastagonospora nodorum SN15]